MQDQRITTSFNSKGILPKFYYRSFCTSSLLFLQMKERGRERELFEYFKGEEGGQNPKGVGK